MKLIRVGDVGAERPALRLDTDKALDLEPITADITADFLSDDGIGRIRRALANNHLPEIDLAGRRVGPPIARPGAVICIGMNYAAHAAETGAPPPEDVVMFYKAPNTIIGPNDDVHLPPASTATDWEVELAAIIGRRARYLPSPEDALDYVAGYAISNDVSERTLQLQTSGGQWSKGKSCETFNPLGPWLLTADEIPDPQRLRLRSWVNGEPRQDSTTEDMIFTVATLVWKLSQVTVLEPGDVINTGTPQGVALSGKFEYLRHGDSVRLAIQGLGHQEQRIR